MKYYEYIIKNQNKNITYSDLLSLDEWKNKRDQILKRDNHYCQDCGFSESFMENSQIIAFNFKDKVQLRSLKKLYKISEFQTTYDIESIEIKIHEKFKKFVGFGNDIIFLISENSFLEKVDFDKDKFSVAYISTKNGYSYLFHYF